MKKTLLVLALGTLGLTACFPAILVSGGVAAGTMLATDSRSLQTISDDTSIQHEAIQKLKADPAFGDDSEITATSFNYVVLLTGQVPSDQLRAKAEQDVQSVPRIRRVYNMIKVAPTTGFIQDTDDATISANIKFRMSVTSDLNSNNFKYIVENKVVYLMGYATHAQAKLALDVIRNSSGVTKVVNLVEYSDDSNTEPTPKTTVVTASAPATTSADAGTSVTTNALTPTEASPGATAAPDASTTFVPTTST